MHRTLTPTPPYSVMEVDPTLYDLATGSILAGRFRIVGAHRVGELATAFEVDDQAAESPSQSRCELHVFPAGIFESEEQALAFAASWKPWMRLNSDSVQGIREVVQVARLGYLLVSDFPQGEQLRAVLEKRERVSVTEGLLIGQQMLEGLVALHTHGLVHGDVKPATVYISGEGDAMSALLVDGGVTHGLWSAKDLGEKTALIGTPFYAPVEQFGGDAPDIQSDVYNAATVMFELLTGVLPWPGRSFLEVFQAKLDKTPPSMRERAPDVEIDPKLERVVVTGLLADKSERYPSAKEFLDELRSCG